VAAAGQQPDLIPEKNLARRVPLVLPLAPASPSPLTPRPSPACAVCTNERIVDLALYLLALAVGEDGRAEVPSFCTAVCSYTAFGKTIPQLLERLLHKSEVRSNVHPLSLTVAYSRALKM